MSGSTVQSGRGKNLRAGTHTCPHCGVLATVAHITSTGGYCFYRCDACGEIVFYQLDSKKNILDQYPKRVVKVHDSVPEGVRRDFKEAVTCLDAGAPRAAAVMCRRSLQNSAIERGAPVGKKLWEQLKWLSENNKITPDLYELGEQIRDFGNIGAHPDELDDVTPEDAEGMVSFSETYFKYVYEMPAEVAERKARRAKPSPTTPQP